MSHGCCWEMIPVVSMHRLGDTGQGNGPVKGRGTEGAVQVLGACWLRLLRHPEL